MNCKKLIVAIIGLGVSAFTGSSAMAHGGGGGGHGGGGFGGGGFHGGGFGGGGFRGGSFGGFRGGFNGGAFAAGLTVVAFAEIDSAIATSTIDSSSLAILGTRSFTIPIHITATIPTAIILMVTDTVAFVAVAFVAVAFAVVAFVVVAFVAVGDPYNQPVYQGSGGYTDSLIGRVQLRLARAGYYYGSIDSVSDSGTRAEADP